MCNDLWVSTVYFYRLYIYVFKTNLSTLFNPYLQSKKESKVCKNTFAENEDYIKVGTKIDFIANTKLVLAAIIFIVWILFTVVAYLLKVANSRKESNIHILKWVPLGFSALIFIAITVGISFKKFDPGNFCLMNSQDGLCSSDETDCFTKASESLFTSDFGFGKFLVINSTAEKVEGDLGKRYKIFGENIKLH